jgi:hypothetical protein
MQPDHKPSGSAALTELFINALRLLYSQQLAQRSTNCNIRTVPEKERNKEDTEMKTAMWSGLMVAAVALVAAPATYAQSRLAGNVPFEFTANHTTLPAGSYDIMRRGDAWQVRNKDTQQSIFVFGSAKNSRLDDPAQLVFECRGGSQCELREIQLGGGLVGYYVPRPHRNKADAELARVVVVKLTQSAGE